MSEINQLLFLEAVLKGAAGIILVLLPGVAIKALGLAQTPTYFWPRMLGAVLLGMSVASVLEGSLRAKAGLGLSGSIAINLAAIFVLGSHLILARTAPTKRGRLTLWLLVIVLAALSLAEFAFAV